MSECEFSVISSELIRSVLYETIENEIKSKDFKINVEPASQAGTNNFIGIVSRVRFEAKDEAENEHKSLILKTAPQNIERREQFHSRICFVREIYMYDELLPYFRSFEQLKGITEENTFNEYPKCYRTVDVEFDECLLLEDLNNRGFMPINRHKERPNVEHVRLYLRAIAKFHAISMVLKNQQPEKFHQLTSHLDDVFFNRDNAPLHEYFEKQAEYVLSLFIADEEAHLLKKLKTFFGKGVMDIYNDSFELEASEPAAVVSYGDSNLNNSLFRYDNNRKPIEICLLDWQGSRLASPITDIICYLFANVTKDVRDAHYDFLLKEYYESLSTHIRRMGSDPEKLFPYELMQEHLQKFAKYGIIWASIVLPVLTSDPGVGVDLDELANGFASGEDTYSGLAGTLGRKYDERMRDVVIDMVRLGYI